MSNLEDRSLDRAGELLAAGAVSQSLLIARTLFRRAPENLPALALILKAYLHNGDVRKAKWIAKAQRAVEQIERHGSLDERTAALTGRFLYMHGEISAARALGDLLGELFPTGKDASLFRAYLAFGIGEPDAGLQTLRDLVQAHPDDLLCLLRLAEALLDSGRPQDASPIVERLAAEHGRVDTLILCARCRIRLGHTESARSMVMRAVHEFGAGVREAKLVARELPATSVDEFAGELLGFLTEHFPDDPELAQRLANHYVQRQDWDAAAASLERALALGPSEALLLALARAQLQLGRIEEAEATIERLRQDYPEGTGVQFAVAQFLRTRGDSSTADRVENKLIRTIAVGATTRVGRNAQVRILGIIGAHGLGDFIYQLLALSSIKRQFEHASLTLIYRHDFSYKDDVVRFCPDVDTRLDYGGQALNIPVATKNWEEFHYNLVFTQPALSPTLLARFQRTARFETPVEDVERLSQALKDTGLRPDRWFVVIHYRQSSSLPSLAASGRDVDSAAFHDLARYICQDLGGQVVRLGHKGMDPIPQIPGYVDLSTASLELQLFATSKARFMVSCDSGPAAYATAFKIPLLKTNTFSEDGVFYPHDLLLPKNIVTWKEEVLSLGPLMEDRLLFFKTMPTLPGVCRMVDNSLSQLKYGVDLMAERTADCGEWRFGSALPDAPCPDALHWPGPIRRAGQCLDLAHLFGLPVHSVTTK